MLKRIKGSKAARNLAASYFDFFSAAICGLISIPIAVAYLGKVELGIWAIVNGLISYLVWFDLGIGTASARMIAPSINEKDQKEINRWWTLARATMALLGLMAGALFLLSSPLFFIIYDVPDELAKDTRNLIIGAAAAIAFNIPLRGVSGLLTAQGRFHWSPLLHAVTAWINLLVFYLCLRAGLGLVSYVWSMLASLGTQWIAFWLLIHLGPMPPKLDFHGFERSRFRKLMGYSLNIAGMGFVETLVNKVPTMLLGVFGGLGLVPLLHITMRVPTLVSSLVRKTLWSFYPELLRLHVSSENRSLPEKHRQVGEFVLCVGLMAAGAAAILNKTVVVLLAGESFYAGDAVTLVLVTLIVAEPMFRMFQILLNLSGNMGNTGIISLLTLAVATGMSWGGYLLFGMPGLLLALFVQPVALSIYGIRHGIRQCGYKRADFSYRVFTNALFLLFASCVSYMIGSNYDFLPQSLDIGIHNLATPTEGGLFAGTTLICGGLYLLLRVIREQIGNPLIALRRFRSAR